MNTKQLIRSNHAIRSICCRIYSILGKNHSHIKGKNNRIILGPNFYRNCTIRLNGDNNEIIFKESDYFIKNMRISIYGNNNKISIGRNFATNGLRFSIEDNNNFIIIGNDCHGGGNSEFAAIEGTTISLGDDCMLSANISIRTGDSHSIIDNTTCQRLNKSKSVYIGDHVWIGNSVFIFKGAKISSYSVIAGASVVTGKTFPSNTIIGGNPAHVIKENINWLSQRIYS